MAEYIKRDTAIRAVMAAKWVDGSDGAMAMEIVASPSAADVAPVVHGRWDDSGRYTFPSGAAAVRCTNCGCALTESEYHLNNWNYCPVCGQRWTEVRMMSHEEVVVVWMVVVVGIICLMLRR